ncbi:transcription factor TFIIIC subunit tfc4 [Cryptotrichosporon argae]
MSAFDSDNDDIAIDPALLDEPVPVHPRAGQASGSRDVSTRGRRGQSEDDGDNDEDESGGGVEEAVADGAEEAGAAPEAEALKRLTGFVAEGASEEGGHVDDDRLRREVAEMDDEELPSAKRQGRRKRQKPAQKLSYEVSQLLGQANLAYVLQDMDNAIKLFLEVIRRDTQVAAAWQTLATLYAEKGDADTARQMRFCGAHVDGEADTWYHLALEFKEKGNDLQTLYCLRRALKHDPSSVQVLHELLQVYRNTNERGKALAVFRKLVQADPTIVRNLDLLMEMQPMFLEASRQWDLGADVFRAAYNYYVDTFAGPADPRVNQYTGMGPGGASMLSLEHVVALTDLLLKLAEPEQAIDIAKRGQRWLTGRKAETGWDRFNDDREYDPPHALRFGPDDDGDGHGHGHGHGAPREHANQLDDALRYRLATARLRLGHDDEAGVHLGAILALDAGQNEAMFRELAEVLAKRGMWARASEFYNALSDLDHNIGDLDLYFKMAKCAAQLQEWASAKDMLEHIRKEDPANLDALLLLIHVLEDMGRAEDAFDLSNELLTQDAATKMSRSERRARNKLNRRLVAEGAIPALQKLWGEMEAAELAANEPDPPPRALDRFLEAAGSLIETFRLAPKNFGKNRGVTRQLKAPKYVQKRDVHADAIATRERLERKMGLPTDAADATEEVRYRIIRQTEFYGIEAEAWLNLIIKYCCVLAVTKEADVALDILEHVVVSGLFYNRRSEVAIRLVTMACAMKNEDYERVVRHAQRLAQMHQFRPEPFLILQACLSGGGRKASAAWGSAKLKDFIAREVRLGDLAVKRENLKWSSRERRWVEIIKAGAGEATTRSGWKSQRAIRGDAEERDRGDAEDDDNEDAEGHDAHTAPAQAADGADDDELRDAEDAPQRDGTDDPNVEGPRPTKLSPVLNTIYGQQMLTRRSYQSALFYLISAYEACPYDPFVCFLIAQCYLGHAMNRQSDNRDYQIAQGLAFMTKYRELSPRDPATQEEVEYNFGRAFMSLGVPHLAASHFERVLKSVHDRMEDGSDDPDAVKGASHAFEAAHNLCIIYASVGSHELVRQRSQWLAI